MIAPIEHPPRTRTGGSPDRARESASPTTNRLDRGGQLERHVRVRQAFARHRHFRPRGRPPTVESSKRSSAYSSARRSPRALRTSRFRVFVAASHAQLPGVKSFRYASRPPSAEGRRPAGGPHLRSSSRSRTRGSDEHLRAALVVSERRASAPALRDTPVPLDQRVSQAVVVVEETPLLSKAWFSNARADGRRRPRATPRPTSPPSRRLGAARRTRQPAPRRAPPPAAPRRAHRARHGCRMASSRAGTSWSRRILSRGTFASARRACVSRQGVTSQP